MREKTRQTSPWLRVLTQLAQTALGGIDLRGCGVRREPRGAQLLLALAERRLRLLHLRRVGARARGGLRRRAALWPHRQLRPVVRFEAGPGRQLDEPAERKPLA